MLQVNQYTAVIPPDDGEGITFKWHFPRGTLEKRMSGKELATFVLHHMAAVLSMGLFDAQPAIKAEFTLLLERIVNYAPHELDEVLAWLQPLVRQEDDDTIFMSVFAEGIPAAPKHFLVTV